MGNFGVDIVVCILCLGTMFLLKNYCSVGRFNSQSVSNFTVNERILITVIITFTSRPECNERPHVNTIIDACVVQKAQYSEIIEHPEPFLKEEQSR